MAIISKITAWASVPGLIVMFIGEVADVELEDESEPVASPSPTRTPRLPELTTRECSYFSTVSDVLIDTSDANFAMADLFAKAGDDPLVILDDGWRIDIALQFALIEIARDEIRALSPPASLSGLHSQLVALGVEPRFHEQLIDPLAALEQGLEVGDSLA